MDGSNSIESYKDTDAAEELGDQQKPHIPRYFGRGVDDRAGGTVSESNV